jgi:DNA-binding response OmpR family regulator
MRASVLIIEDDSDVAELISMYLKDEGIEPRVAGSAEEGLAMAKDRACDLVVLDLNLPGMDGFEFLKGFRASSSVPVLIASSRESDEDIIMGLGLGADEFVGKPFSPRVLAARVKAHLRRSGEKAREGARIGELDFDPETLIAERDGRRVSMPTKEAELLAYLYRRRGQAVPSEEIYRDVWDNSFGDLTTVAVHVQRLRRRIEPDPSKPIYIRTVYGIGYRLDAAEPGTAKGRP